MSIVICVVKFGRKMYLASDKRAIKDGRVSDDFQKTFQIREKVFYSITGIAEPGIWYLDRLKERYKMSIKDLINWCDIDFVTHSFPKLAILISGKDENGDFFIWSKNDSGESNMADVGFNKIAFTISSNQNILLFNNHFSNAVVAGNSMKDSIASTIRMASSIDKSISPTFDLIVTS